MKKQLQCVQLGSHAWGTVQGCRWGSRGLLHDPRFDDLSKLSYANPGLICTRREPIGSVEGDRPIGLQDDVRER